MTIEKMEGMTLKLPLDLVAALLRGGNSVPRDVYPDTGESGDAYDSELGMNPCLANNRLRTVKSSSQFPTL